MSVRGGETFTDRFNRLTADLSDSDLMGDLGLSYHAVRKLRSGDTKTLKLDGALRLCKRLGITPWELAGEAPPTAQKTVPAPDSWPNLDHWFTAGTLLDDADPVRGSPVVSLHHEAIGELKGRQADLLRSLQTAAELGLDQMRWLVDLLDALKASGIDLQSLRRPPGAS